MALELVSATPIAITNTPTVKLAELTVSNTGSSITNADAVIWTTKDSSETVTVGPTEFSSTGVAAIGYTDVDSMEVSTQDGDDQISVTFGTGLPTSVTIDAGDPTSSDSLTVYGTSGNDTITLSGNTVDDGSSTISLVSVEDLTISVGDGNDGISVELLDSDLLNSLTLNGQGDNDSIVIDSNGTGAGGTVDFITFPVTVDGGGQSGDTLTLNDESDTSRDTIDITPTQVASAAVPAGAALFTGNAPTLDGIVSAGEWDSIPVAFDTGERPNGGAGNWDLSGARGRFAWDDTNWYGLVEAYPNTGTPSPGENANGPFDQINFESYINALGWPAAVFLDSTAGDNNHPGSTVVFGTTDWVDTGNSLARMVIEFSVPINTIVDATGGNLPNPYTFDPTSGDFLEYRVRTTDPDSSGGFDSRDQTAGWIVEPPVTSGAWRKMEFAQQGTFFGAGGILNYAGLDQLSVTSGTDADEFTVAPSTDTEFLIYGGDPTTTPGDVLNFITPGVQTATLINPGPDLGTIQTTGGYQDVVFDEIERLNFGGNVVVNGTGEDDLLVIDATDADSGTFQLTSDGVPDRLSAWPG